MLPSGSRPTTTTKFTVRDLDRFQLNFPTHILSDYIANPGSLLWLTTDRPYANDTCADVDVFKYGLSDKFPGYATGEAKKMGRDGLVERYRNRNLHYAWGMVSVLFSTS